MNALKKIIFSFLLSPLSFLLSTAQVTFIIDSLPAYTPAEDTLYIAGTFNGWNPGLTGYELAKNPEDSWQITLVAQAPGTQIQFKFTRGSWDRVEKGPNGEEIPNRMFTYGNGDTVSVIIYNWADAGGGGGSTAAENVSVIDEDFYMPQLNRTRRIWIYLPPDYEQSEKQYPVMYMHDGQNLFDDYTSFLGEWHVDETLNDMAAQGFAVPIVVGIDNGGSYRIGEYTPWPNPQYGGGEGSLYIDFIVETLKPFIDTQYRTMPGREGTCIMGSSLGGLISHYGVLKYQDVFSKAGIFSPSYWFSDSIWGFTSQMGKQGAMKLYQMAGDHEGASVVPNMMRMQDSLLLLGFTQEEILTKVVTGGQHNEQLWSQEFGEAYLWLFASYALGIESVGKTEQTVLFPNPVNSLLHFPGKNDDSIIDLKIYSLAGSCVYIIDVVPDHQVDVSHLAPGIYFAQWKEGKESYWGRFVKSN